MDLRDQIKQQLKENQKSRGFGDTFEKFTTFTGVHLSPGGNLFKTCFKCTSFSAIFIKF